MPRRILKLSRTKKGNFYLSMDAGTMSVIQNTVHAAFNLAKLSEIDKIIFRSLHDYCWAWNKLDTIINDGVMDKNLNGHGEFYEILEKELGWWAKEKGLDLKAITSVKCSRCGTVVDRIDVLRCLERGDEPRCPQCPGQGYDGKALKLVPVENDG